MRAPAACCIPAIIRPNWSGFGTQPDVFKRVKTWASFGEYLFLRLFGDAVTSTSMVSGTGPVESEQQRLRSGNYGRAAGAARAVRAERSDGSAAGPVEGRIRAALAGVERHSVVPALGDGAWQQRGERVRFEESFRADGGNQRRHASVIEEDHVEIPPAYGAIAWTPSASYWAALFQTAGRSMLGLRSTLQLPPNEELEKQLRQ